MLLRKEMRKCRTAGVRTAVLYMDMSDGAYKHVYTNDEVPSFRTRPAQDSVGR